MAATQVTVTPISLNEFRESSFRSLSSSVLSPISSRSGSGSSRPVSVERKPDELRDTSQMMRRESSSSLKVTSFGVPIDYYSRRSLSPMKGRRPNTVPDPSRPASGYTGCISPSYSKKVEGSRPATSQTPFRHGRQTTSGEQYKLGSSLQEQTLSRHDYSIESLKNVDYASSKKSHEKSYVPGYSGYIPKVKKIPGKSKYHYGADEEVAAPVTSVSNVNVLYIPANLHKTNEKFLVGGYTGHVPRRRELHGMSYEKSTYVANEITHGHLKPRTVFCTSYAAPPSTVEVH